MRDGPQDGAAPDPGRTARLDRSLEDAMLLDRDGYTYVIHPLMDGVPRVHPDLLRAWADWAGQQDVLKGADLLVAPEAMALPLAAVLGQATGLPYVVVRKRAYHLEGERRIQASTGYGTSGFHLNDVHQGERAVLVDDVLSTGGTAAAVLEALRAAGVVPVGALVFLDKEDRARHLARQADVPVRVMRRMRIEEGRPVVLPGDP